MGFDRIRIKENAKTHYSLNKWNNVLVAFIFSIITGAISGITSSISGVSSNSDSSAGVAVTIYIVNIAAMIFVTNVLSMGVASWYQKAIHTDKLDMGAMFDTFRVNYMDNVLTMFLKNLYIFLWSLLFVIPGIVKTYAYSMTEFIKAENPNIPASKAIDMSNRMTQGRKGDLFMLDLSFLGWFILSSFTCGILMIVYVGPYYYAAKAFAYEEIKAEAIASGKVSEYDFVQVVG